MFSFGKVNKRVSVWLSNIHSCSLQYAYGVRKGSWELKIIECVKGEQKSAKKILWWKILVWNLRFFTTGFLSSTTFKCWLFQGKLVLLQTHQKCLGRKYSRLFLNKNLLREVILHCWKLRSKSFLFLRNNPDFFEEQKADKMNNKV